MPQKHRLEIKRIVQEHMQGIRFPACDFTAAQLRHALELADRARSGDAEAGERIVEMITHGLLHEALM